MHAHVHLLTLWTITVCVFVFVYADQDWCTSNCSCYEFDIHCDRNNLSSVPDIPEKHTEQVTLLNLSENHLVQLTNDTFVFYSSLKTLHMERNDIAIVQPTAFHGLFALKELYLQHNELHSLPNSVFRDTFNLEVLDLSYNQIESLPEQLLWTTDLVYIDLSMNHIQSIDDGLLRHCLNLTTINLSNNPLEILSGKALSGLNLLHSVLLRNTMLFHIDSDLYIVFGALEILDLSNTGREMDINWSKLKRAAVHLFYLNASGVTSPCGCDIGQSLEWLSSLVPRVSSPSCASPASLKGYLIHDLTPEQIRCPPVKPSVHTSISTWYNGRARNLEPLPYDPMLGWYTAATLGTMLMSFLLCVACDKLKQKVSIYRRVVNDPPPKKKVSLRAPVSCRLDPEDVSVSVREFSSLPAIVFDDDESQPSKSHKDMISLLGSPRREDVIANECPRDAPEKVTTKTIAERPLSPSQTTEAKLQVIEIHPDCPVHSPRPSLVHDENDEFPSS